MSESPFTEPIPESLEVQAMKAAAVTVPFEQMTPREHRKTALHDMLCAVHSGLREPTKEFVAALAGQSKGADTPAKIESLLAGKASVAKMHAVLAGIEKHIDAAIEGYKP